MTESITPGKWHWHDTFGRKNGTGEPIRATDMHPAKVGNVSPFSFAVSDEHGFVIAHCTGSLVTMSSERSEANARAISALPDMIAALQECVRVYREHRDQQPTGHLWPDPNHIHAARQALKAAGFDTEEPRPRAPLSDHEGPARSLVIHTSKGDMIEVLPDERPELFGAWGEWARLQDEGRASQTDWANLLYAADRYLSSLPTGEIGQDETAVDVRAIR